MTMKPNHNLKPYLILAGILAVLMLITAFAGTFFPAIYSDFTRPQRVAESQGQDVVTLFIALPLLLVAARLTRRGDVRGPLFWVGALGYVLYVYLIYAYGGLYNILFPTYVAIMGLCIFSIIGVLNGVDADAVHAHVKASALRKVVAAYFLGTVLLLTFIWGAAVTNAIITKTPDEGTLIYVTDLAFVLPVFALAGVWLWQRKPWGDVLAGVMLVKAVTLGLSIAVGQVIAYAQGVGGDLFLAAFFGAFTVVGIITAGLYLKHFD
jgi:hypothetical protein